MHFIPWLRFKFQNIHKNTRYLHSLLETLQSDTDLLFLQEVPFYHIRNIASLHSEDGEPLNGTVHHPAWMCASKFSDFPSTQVAIFVNRRILGEYTVFTDPFSVPNPNVLELKLTKLSDNASATFFCVYNPPKSQNVAVHDLMARLPDAPNIALIQGDFNLHSEIWDSKHTSDRDIAYDLVHAISARSLDLINDAGVPTWFHPKRESVLDLVFLHTRSSSSRYPLELTIDKDGRGPGDHALISLSFDREWTWRGEAYIKGGSDEEGAFLAVIGRAIQEGAKGLQSDINLVFQDIRTQIDNAWTTYSRRPKVNSNPTMWWNDECKEAKDRLAKERSPQVRASFKNTVRRAQREFFQKRLKRMTAPWEGVSWTKARRPPTYSIVKDSNTPVSSIDHLWDVFNRQFNFSQASPVDWDFVNNIPARDERAFPPISTYEVKTTLQSTINTSAPGTDHVTWRHLKILLSDYEVATAITTLYNRIIDEGIWPSPLKESLSIIIPKPGKSDYSTPKAYHPIALLSVLGKLLTKILAKRLQYEAIAFDLLHPGQFGGIQKHATTDVGLVLTDIIVKARERGLFTSVLALDIAQFFPSLDHGAMACILTKLGFNRKIAGFAASFFAGRTTRFKWGSAESGDILCSQGTPQGDCLSPILSALYLAPILHLFCPWDIEKPLNILVFVDDGTLITSSDSIEANVSRLSSEYKNLTTLLGKLGLHAEHSKLELMHFMAFDVNLPQRKFKKASLLPLVIHQRGSELRIDAKEVWRYLGFFFDPYLSFNHHIQQYTNKAFSALRA